MKPFSNNKSQLTRLIALGTLLTAGAWSSAQATVVTLPLNFKFSGTVPGGPVPWLELKLEDGLATNTVRMTFDAGGLSGAEFVEDWYVNLNPLFNPTSLIFTIIDKADVPNFSLGDIGKGTDSFKVDGDGHYDLKFDFPPPPGQFSAKFTAGEVIVVDAYRAAGLTVDDFLYPSVKSSGNGVYYTAAHIQGIGGSSAWVGTAVIPEPSTYAAIIGALALGATTLRRRFVRSI